MIKTPTNNGLGFCNLDLEFICYLVLVICSLNTCNIL